MKAELEQLSKDLREVKDELFYNVSVSNITYEKVNEALKTVRELESQIGEF